MDKHPKSLRIFFATEMWERYGFYVVQSLLALYLALHYNWPDQNIYDLVGSFTALTYLSPLVGGWIADKLIGQKCTVLLGAFVLCISYCLLSFIDNSTSLTSSLAGIAVGTGLLKPNISSLLGNEYPVGSALRTSGFTIFYMGITSGIILGTTLPSLLSHHLGWSSSFISAALGMVIAFFTFLYGMNRYSIKDYNPRQFQVKNLILALGMMFTLGCLSFYILNSPKLAQVMFGLVVLASVSYILYSVNNEDLAQSRQTLVIGLLCIISAIFWAFYFQMFMSITLFISRVVQPTFLGIDFPPPYYITIQSIGMLIIGSILAKQHHQLTLNEQGISSGKKFLIAMVMITASYSIIALISSASNDTNLLSPLLIIPAFLLISCAELLLSPVGLSAVTILADKNKVSTMMGVFFVSLGIGGFLSGKLASLTAIPQGETNILILKKLYATAFTQQLGILFIATLGCFVLYAVIKFLLTHVQVTAENKSQ